MTSTSRTPLRFSLLTIIVWLAVAAGIIFLLWQVITRISASKLPTSTATPNLTQVYQTNVVNMTAQHSSSASPTSMGITPSPTTSPTIRITQAPKPQL